MEAIYVISGTVIICVVFLGIVIDNIFTNYFNTLKSIGRRK